MRGVIRPPRLAIRLLTWFGVVGILPSAVLGVLAYRHVAGQEARHTRDSLAGLAETRARLIRSEIDRRTAEEAARPGVRPWSEAMMTEGPRLTHEDREALEAGAARVVGGYLLRLHDVGGARRLGSLPLEQFDALLAPSPGPGETGSVYVIDAQGRVVATGGRAGTPRLPIPAGATDPEPPEGDWIVAWAPAGPWRVVAQARRSEVLREVRHIAVIVAMLSLFLIAAVCGVLYLIGRRVEREYGRMAGSIERASRGEFGGEADRSQPTTLRQVRHALDEMHSRLGERDGEILRQRQELFCQRCELERLNSEIVQADRMKSEFVANMSHEVRTPLHSILSLSRVLLDQRSGPLTEEQRKQVGIIERSGGSLLKMLGDILDFSKIEAGRMTVDPQDVSPAALLAGVREELAALAAEKGLELSLEVDEEAPRHIRSDPEKLHRVLLNLAHNAIKFTARGRVVLRALGRERGGVAFEVSDTGPGIPRAMAEGVFEPFRQVDGSTTRAAGGTGLGLSIVKSLVGLLGGRIALESGPGAGSTFRVVLPAGIAPRAAAGPRPVAGGGDVLVVGAPPPAAEAVRAELRAAGFRAGRAVCGRDVRSALDRTGIGAVLLDVGLFAHEGVDVFSSLAGRPHAEGTPMIGYWVDPNERRGNFLGRLSLEPGGNGDFRLVTNRAPELPLPSHVEEDDRRRAEAWTEEVQARDGVAFHEVMRRVIDRLDETLGHERRTATGQTALVIDPDQASRYALILELEGFGCTVRAADRWEAIPEDVKPDLVVTELDVPGVAHPVAALRARFHAPILVLTAEARGERHAEARNEGAAAVEVKPTSPREMLQRMLYSSAERSS